MDEHARARWLKQVTREETLRGVARAAGVSHTTVRRWVADGIPATSVWDLVLRFRGDPIAAMVLLGRIGPDDVARLNFEAIAEYMPTWVMTEEVNKRAGKTRTDYAHIKLQKRRVEL